MKTVTAETRMIAITQLRVAPWNARKTFDLETMASLTESIKLHGVQVPLIVRPLDVMSDIMSQPEAAAKGGQAYEIVAGHRRFKAAAILKLAELPCIVRELDDAAAREIGLIDNLQREDIPAMEEAEAFGELLDRLLSIAAVASRVGKEQSYVAKSLKLRTLTPWSRDALREKLITIDHALLLCRLAEAEQNQALKWCLDRQAGVKVPVEDVLKKRLDSRKDNEDPDDDTTEQAVGRARWRREWEPESVLRLKEHIECETGVPLDRAPWDVDEDYLLPDAGSCLDCPKNTKANAPLFGDLEMGVAVCTDGVCFKGKTTAFVQVQGRDEAKRAALKAGKPPVPGAFEPLRVSWKATSTPPRLETVPICKCGPGKNCTAGEGCRGVPKTGQIFKDGQWTEAKKKCEHAQAAVTVDWSDGNDRGQMGRGDKLRKPGEIVQACIEPKCKVHPKDWAKPKGQSRQRGGVDPEKERQALERFNRFVASEKPVRRAVYDAVMAKMKPDTLKRNLLLAMQRNFNLCTATGFEGKGWTDCNAHAEALIKKAAGADLDALLFHATFGGALIVDGNAPQAKDKGRGKLRDMAKVAGVDAAAIERKFDAPAKPKAEAKVAKVARPAAKTAVKKKPAKKAVKKGGRK